MNSNFPTTFAADGNAVSETTEAHLFIPEIKLQDIGRAEFGISHNLCNHPLLNLEAIADMADTLPAMAVECHEAMLPLLMPGGSKDLKVRPSDIVRSIDTNGTWMVLWNIEQVPAYRELLDEILDPLVTLLPVVEGDMGRREAFLFLSAPDAVTPCHFDPESNFLLQIRGSKEVNIGRFKHRSIALKELDRYHDGGHRNLEMMPPCSSLFNLEPGDGVHIYPWAPHWVYNGSTASISLSVTFRTRRSEREELAHRYNSRLRRLGYSPRPAGESIFVDTMKASWISAKAWVRRGGRPQYGARDSRAGGTY